jgi:diguanylate cyclase (GGDEF)-like protein
MTIERFFKFIIPTDFAKDIVKLSFAKNLVGACIISIIAAPAYAILYYCLKDYVTTYAIIITEIFLLAPLIIIKYFHSLYYATAIFVSALTIFLCWSTYHLGGIYSATAYWLILPPLVAAFIGGIRLAFFWCAVSILITTGMFYLESIHFHFPISSISNPLLLQYIAICGLIAIIVALIYFYETDKKYNLKKLHHIAYHDQFTRLPNRMAYENILDQAVAKAKVNHSKFAIFYIDIDKFNKINTVFGRHIGDLLLKEIVHRIQRYIRRTDAMARIGGDEFKIVIELAQDDESIKELANFIHMAIQIPYHIKEDEINVTASIGIAIFPNDGIEKNIIDRAVDMALSKAKNLGGNQLHHFTESLAIESQTQTEIEYFLSDAIKNNELALEFQPQFDIKEATKITGLEALLRWNNKKIGDISPSFFIPIAERIGIINPFGEWILKKACLQYVIWLKAGLTENIPLAINISVHQLYNENFLTSVKDVIDETGIPPEKLELELTETAIITDLPRAISMLQNLSDLGVRIVIDDFGAGYTSLSYLDLLPISALKIDKSLLDNFRMNSSRSIIIESIIELAHKINLTVVVEGIENLEQLNYLKQIHCDYAQGYYLSKPLDILSMQKLLVEGKR